MSSSSEDKIEDFSSSSAKSIKSISYIHNYDHSTALKQNQWYEDEAVKARICSEEKKKKHQKRLMMKQQRDAATRKEFD